MRSSFLELVFITTIDSIKLIWCTTDFCCLFLSSETVNLHLTFAVDAFLNYLSCEPLTLTKKMLKINSASPYTLKRKPCNVCFTFI